MLERKRIKGPGRCIEVRVCSRPRCNQEYGIDNAGKGLDACVFYGQDEGRSTCIAAAVEQARVVVGNNETNHEDGENVEEENTPEDTLDGLGNVLAGVLDLTDSDTDDLSSSKGKGRLDENVPEGEETAKSTADTASRLASDGVGSPEELSHRSGVFPVAEAKAVTARTSAKVDDERGNDENNDGDNLDEAEPELGLTVVLDAEEVDTDDEDKEDRDPCGRVDGGVGVPVLNQNGRGGNLGWDGNTVRVPVSPTKSETKTWVEEASGVVSEASGTASRVLTSPRATIME